jgi:hypothetical protein
MCILVIGSVLSEVPKRGFVVNFVKNNFDVLRRVETRTVVTDWTRRVSGDFQSKLRIIKFNLGIWSWIRDFHDNVSKQEIGGGPVTARVMTSLM